MNFVQPIRDPKKIAQIKNTLRGEKRYRDLLLFTVGIISALRISDLLELRVHHFIDEVGNNRQRFVIEEQKRGKRNEITINASMREALAEYRLTYPEIENDPSHFVFFNTRNKNFTRSVTRQTVRTHISNVCHAVGLQGNYGTHTMRKTGGYHAYKHGVPLVTIMKKLNHSRPDVTMRYIGITDDELAEVANRLNL